MLSPEKSQEALTRFFHHHQIADMGTLFKVLQTKSRMNVFRRLSALDYLSSYNQTGRYYTLMSIPEFDEDGLWQYRGVYFSTHGSLKVTVRHLVWISEAGKTHGELNQRLGVRVHNTLLDLVRHQELGRERVMEHYLYVHRDPQVAHAQIVRRRENGWSDALHETKKIGGSVVIEVLLEVIHGAHAYLAVEDVAARLSARGVFVSTSQVQAIFEEHSLKKTAKSRSMRSKR